MKSSYILLIVLFVICISLPLILRLSEGMEMSTDENGNVQYTYTNDLDSLPKSTTGISSLDNSNVVENLNNTSYSYNLDRSNDAAISNATSDEYLTIINYLRTLIKRVSLTFETRPINDVSDNILFDISGNQGSSNRTQNTSSEVPINCIADFGTDVGEYLCCGQEGVLQNTQYVCPHTKPTCSNFKCGTRFGTCS